MSARYLPARVRALDAAVTSLVHVPLAAGPGWTPAGAYLVRVNVQERHRLHAQLRYAAVLWLGWLRRLVRHVWRGGSMRVWSCALLAAVNARPPLSKTPSHDIPRHEEKVGAKPRKAGQRLGDDRQPQLQPEQCADQRPT